MLPVSTTQLESSVSALSCRQTLLADSTEPRQPLWDTSAQPIDYQSNVDGYSAVQQQNDDSFNQTDYWSLNSTGLALGLTTCSFISSSSDNFPSVAAAAIYSDTSRDHSTPYPPSSQHVYRQPAATRIPGFDGWNVDGQSLDERGSSIASDVGSFSTNTSEPGGVLPTDRTTRLRSTEADRNVLGTEPPRSSVITLAQQLDTYWAQRSNVVEGSQSAVQQDRAWGVKPVSRPTAPPPAPPGPLTSTYEYLDTSSADYDEQLTRQTQTLPRAGSTRSLQAAPPPRPPPRTTTHDSYNTSTLFGRSLPPEPTQMADMQTTFDRISLCQGQMTTFQSPRTLKESSGQGGLSGSVQSLPGCDVTATSLTLGSTLPRARAAPQPPRRGSSMSPRLQTKSTRYGVRARSASLRSNDDDDIDADVLQRLTNSSSSTHGQQLEAPAPTTNVGVRETARQATVSGQKPVAQIRPHAIRSPSASSFTRQRISDDADSKCSTEARIYFDQQTAVQAQATDVQSSTMDSAGVSSDRQSTTAGNSTVSRFGTLRSRIRDYVTAAAGVGTNRKQQMTSSSSSSFADWTLPRGRRPGAARRSSSATSWEPDQSDYASGGNEPSCGGTASFDDGTAWSSSSYFGVFPGPRPFSSPRTRATEVSLPQNIVASADSSMSTSDVTSSITSRINTFLTFLGGSRRPAGSLPTSDTPPSASLRPGPTSAAIERPSNNAPEVRTPTAKAVVDPTVSTTLERQSRSVSASPPVRSSSTSEMLAKAAAAAAAAARDARGRQPLRFVREQRTAMSTFRNSGSLNVSVARSSSFSPHSTSAAREGKQSPPFGDVSDGRRTSKSGTAGQASSLGKHLPYSHQSAPSTPLDSNDAARSQQTMTSSLPLDNSDIRSQTADSGDSPATTKETRDVIAPRASTTAVPLSVFRQVDVEVELLIELLQKAAVPNEPPSGRDADRSGTEVEAARESLLALTRQFVDDSQRLVSGATRSVDALVAGVEPSLITLTRLAGECQSTAALLSSPSQGVMLVGRVRDLAQAYRSTVSAARSAVGRPFNSVEMKSLMRQATSLAAILSSLIKMLNRTDIIC